MTADEIRFSEAVAAVVAKAPPLTAAQKARLAVVFRPPATLRPKAARKAA